MIVQMSYVTGKKPGNTFSSIGGNATETGSAHGLGEITGT